MSYMYKKRSINNMDLTLYVDETEYTLAPVNINTEVNERNMKIMIRRINPVSLIPKILFHQLNALPQYPQWTQSSRATKQANFGHLKTSQMWEKSHVAIRTFLPCCLIDMKLALNFYSYRN